MIQALQSISKGTEITINYCATIEDTLKDRTDRRAHLNNIWGFNCECTICKGGPSANEARRGALEAYRELSELREELEQSRVEGTDEGTCEQTHEPQRRVLELYDSVFNNLRTLGIIDQKLSEM